MANYVMLLQWTEQGVRDFRDTTKRAADAKAAAEKMGVKMTQMLWTLGAYDLVLLAEAPDDETMTALSLKVASLGNVRTQTLRAFNASEVEAIVNKAR